MPREERILEFMRREGPMLPNKLARFLGTDLIIAGAHLSELSSRKVVLITHLKVGGGSPIYYLPGQEEKLQQFYGELNGKDKASYDLLKEKKVLRDKGLDPLTRVSLRNTKDFAKPLQVNLGEDKEIFWKWYLLKNEEAVELIKGLLKPKIEAKKEEPIVKEELTPPKIDAKEEAKPEPVKVEPVKREEKIEEETKTEVKKEPETKKEIKKPEEKQEVLEAREGESARPRKEEPKEAKKKKEIQSDFFEKVKSFLNLKNIKIAEADALRKTEINLILKVPTAVGEILYYAKAKAKKKCSDKDVSSAFLEGQMKKLPVLFLYSGEITKKTEEMLQQDIFKNLILLHLD